MYLLIGVNETGFQFLYILSMVTATSLVILPHLDDQDAIQMHSKQPVKVAFIALSTYKPS